jgi:tubulin-specific chaperone D
VLQSLATACAPSATVGGEGDAETRRNAITALADLCEEVGIGSSTSSNSNSSSNSSSSSSSNSTAVVTLQLQQVELVFAALLAATGDYSTDKRGDVGSWCRAAALQALERITNLAVTASIGIPLERPPTAASTAQLTVPALQQRLCYMEITVQPDGAVGMLPERAAQLSAAVGEVYFTPELCEALLCALLKQLAEKLDAVRDVAGSVLQRLLTAQLPQLRLPYVPCRRQLVAALQLESQQQQQQQQQATTTTSSSDSSAVNWATPAVTFPMVVKALSLPPYHAAVASGLVISVGGLTESVVKHSAAALLSWARAAGGGNTSSSSSNSSSSKKSTAAAADMSALATLGASLTALLTAHSGDDRVALPLLRTLDLLLANDAFAPLPPAHPFGQHLLAAVRSELRSCRSVPKICAGGGVLLGLISFSGGTGTGALRSALGLLAHKFPRVRKHMAELMYVRLLAAGDEHEQPEAVAAPTVSAAAGGAEDGQTEPPLEAPPTFTPEAIDDALDLLTGAVWDGTQEEARSARDALAGVLHVELPAAAASGSRRASGSTGAAKDELESYEALVRDAGY